MSDDLILDIVPPQGSSLPPELRARLDPQWIPIVDNVDPTVRQSHEAPPRMYRFPEDAPHREGTSLPVPVGRTLDLDLVRKYTDTKAPKVRVRVLWPHGGQRVGEKLPCLLYIHGGGFVFGNRASELHIATRLCVNANAVVVKVDYRLAPEDLFPAAVEDCWEALQWIVEDARAPDGGVLGIDETRIALGGVSAGGNLSIVLSHMLLSTPRAPKNFRLKFLLPIIPAVDLTAGDPTIGSPTWNDYPSWDENEHAPTLNKAKCDYFTNLYLPNKAYRLNWHASPILAPEEHYNHLPPTHITVAELDPLRDQGLLYAKKCATHGVKVTTKAYKGLPHSAVGLDANVDAARQWIQDLCDVLKAQL